MNGVAVVGGSRDRQTAIGDEEIKSGEGSLLVVPASGTAQLDASKADVTPSRGNLAVGEGNSNRNTRQRFSNFNFHKLQLHRKVTGPALTVVDAERNAASQSATVPGETQAPATSRIRDGDGVKVTIRLVALDEHGEELESPNEQLIYLHIVREGTRSDVGDDDAKPWVVKVVKREATVKPRLPCLLFIDY